MHDSHSQAYPSFLLFTIDEIVDLSLCVVSLDVVIFLVFVRFFFSNKELISSMMMILFLVGIMITVSTENL